MIKAALFSAAVALSIACNVIAAPKSPTIVIDKDNIITLLNTPCTSKKVANALRDLGASPEQTKEAMGKAYATKVRSRGRSVAACYILQENTAYFMDEAGQQFSIPLESFGVVDKGSKGRM